MTSQDSSFAFDHAERAAEAIRRRIHIQPRIGLILGSGLGKIADDIEDHDAVPYGDIPYFPVSTAPGHAGSLVVGNLEGCGVLAMSGRAHLYEGYRVDQVVLPVRAMSRLGIRTVIITNAAGGIRSGFRAGTLMTIADHINLTGENPLVGPNDVRFGVRFPDMTEAYSLRLREVARNAAVHLGIELEEGVYLGLRGPTYETPAEVRMARTLGADAVGMSTVLEVIAANHIGMQVLGFSCITNMAAGLLPQKLHHDEVIETARRTYGVFSALVKRVVANLK